MLHRDTHITNLRGLSLTTPGESDGFCANHQRVALPLLSAGGQIAVLEVLQSGATLGAITASSVLAPDAPGDALLSISSPNQAVSPTWLCPPSRMVQQCPTSPGTPLTHGALQSVRTGTSTLPWVAVPHVAAHPLPVSLCLCRCCSGGGCQDPAVAGA